MENSFYIPINLETIQLGSTHSFDVFFKTKEEKMILYCAGGEKINEKVFEKIKEFNVSNLYIRKLDKEYYDIFVEESLNNILASTQISPQVKARTAYNSILNVARSLFEDPKAEMIQRYKNVIYVIVNYIFKEDDALLDMIKLTTFDYSTYNHSINVGFLSIGLAKELLKDQPDHDFVEMGKGFFLHDIGKCMIPVQLLQKKEPLSYSEWELIKRHPNEGIRILTKFNEQSDVINKIVLQHHERHNGKGYPRGLKGNDIHIYSKICSIADTFDGLTSHRPYREKYLTFDALRIMKNEMFKYFEPEFFNNFIKLFGR